jgi:SAM-dependent methyltransferase
MTKKIGYQSGYIYHKARPEPKETFKFLAEKMALQDPKSELSVLDIGCASGDLLAYLTSFPGVTEGVGVEFDRKLVKLANQSKIPKSKFYFGSAETFHLKRKFDRISMSGVLTIFDDFRPALTTLLKHLKPKGRAYILSIFNDFDIDVHIQFRNNKYSSKWQKGYNLFPLVRVREFLKKKGYKMNVYTHVMPFDLPRQDDPLRAWTIQAEGERHLVNGLGLLYNLKVLEISKG